MPSKTPASRLVANTFLGATYGLVHPETVKLFFTVVGIPYLCYHSHSHGMKVYIVTGTYPVDMTKPCRF